MSWGRALAVGENNILGLICPNCYPQSILYKTKLAQKGMQILWFKIRGVHLTYAVTYTFNKVNILLAS